MAAATEARTEKNVPSPTTPKSPINVEIKTVEVSNIAMAVTEKDIWEFFSFSGNIHYIEMKSDSEATKHAFVTFKEAQGANTAVLLTGAIIGNLPVSVSHVENYQMPAGAPPLSPRGSNSDRTREVAQKAEEVVSTMLAKGFVLGKDAVQKAKSFDEKHQLTVNASAKVASIDRRMGLTQKFSMGTAAMNERMKEVNERYQVSEKSKSAIAVAEQKANTAGSALMSNKFVSSGAVWVAGAFAAVAKAAEGVGSKIKEKVTKAEVEKERSKTTENDGSKKEERVQKGEEEKEGSKTTEKVHKVEEEKEGLKSTEKVQRGEEEGSNIIEKVQKPEEGSNKDSTVTPVKPSNDNNRLPPNQ
ncbi:binding partner of ACD11 1-like [Bidens hawaiensis]|uniref:binding partner of ACD11 1-like n=1 Tax=Bidens hawaiensis TaxID=980011 RepID=UPI00404AA42B